jgi:hypothetical protein
MFVDIVMILVAAYFLYDLVRAYKLAIGNALQRCVAATKAAAASLWTGFTVLVTLIANAVAQLADFLNAPTVATAIQTYMSPKIVAEIMVGIAIINELRRRMQV